MSTQRLMKVLVGQHVSEKSTNVADHANQHVFKVLPNATKVEIRRAVELLFSVKVTDVRVLKVKGKRKRFGARAGVRSDWKKAYVKLAAGHDIDFAGID